MKPEILSITHGMGGEATPWGGFRDKAKHHTHFDSIADFRAWVASEEKRPAPRGTYGARNNVSSHSNRAQQTWDLMAGWNGALELARSGWVEGGERIRRAADSLADFRPETDCENITSGMELPHCDAGVAIDVGAYLDGDENHWLSPVFKTERPQVNIAVNISASCAVDSETMAARGVVVAAAVRHLERVGYAVRVFSFMAHCTCECPPDVAEVFTLLVKDTDQILDESHLAFWLAHPAATRRLGFFVRERAPHIGLDSAYGQPSTAAMAGFNFISDSAHLTRAKREGWHNNPAAAYRAMVEIINSALG